MSKFTLLFAALMAIICAVFAQEHLTAEEMRFHAQESMNYLLARRAATEGDDFQASPNSSAVVDFSQGFSTATLKCLRNNGFIASIPRGYLSLGRVDPNMVSNVANSRAAGFEYVDAYMFPCPTCGHGAAAQLNELWNAFTAHRVNIGMLWLDIEGRQYWSGDYNRNKQFYLDLVAAANRLGAKIGIYSSKVQWTEIFGSAGWNPGGNYPMWYAHYDSNPSCGNFSPFGAWSRPTLKQYIGDTVVCGAGIDISSYC